MQSFRKFRRKRSDTSSQASLPLRIGTSSSAETSGSLNSTISHDNNLEDTKGPLGLTLIHDSNEPLFDFVFVHGLGGGSRKTWAKANVAAHHWPGEWLPREAGFENVRIHSYGYNSDWMKGNDNCLNLHHIGKSLLGEMAVSPHISGSNTSLVLIGHSMGGLVIKKAFMLALQDSSLKELANRVVSFYFLGTPHRGSDSAKMLKSILQVASSSPAYVNDLIRGSGALQSINDEFRQYSGDVELWSFYETQKMKNFGSLIVDPESATLGYREEKQIPMNADHRSICKFDSPADPNYTLIRNALASTIKTITSRYKQASQAIERDALTTIAQYLGVSQEIGDDLIRVQDARMDGTCKWFLGKTTYTQWRDTQQLGPSILWVSGKPATGKSVLAGSVIDDLAEEEIPCSFYFFKHGDHSKSKLSACLRSLAFQMACNDTKCRQYLLQLHDNRAKFDYDNERVIWRTVFMSGILQCDLAPQYWVIDALDECSNPALFLDGMLAKLDNKLQLRILITSRETPEIHRHISSLGSYVGFSQEQITVDETSSDIELVVSKRGEDLLADDDIQRQQLIRTIIAKSKGSFLWTTLVLDELSKAFSQEDTKQILEEIPRGMIPLYHRAISTIAKASRGTKLAKAVLTWTACAVRPLTVAELGLALSIDLEEKFPNFSDSISTLCGQFITIDKLNRVQLVHETAREFLLDEELESEFAINVQQSHARLARVCLEYLTGDELKPRRTGRRPSTAPGLREKSEFFVYARGAFSVHLSKADPGPDAPLKLLDKFFKSNVLTWIEDIAERKAFGAMVHAAKDLQIYLDMCLMERSPLRPDIQNIKSWTTDLQRIAGKFSTALISMPSAIYSMISPLCPTNSAIHNIATPGRKLSVVGLSSQRWDDRLSCIDFREGQTSALCYGEEFLAIGLTGGRIALYHSSSSQEYRALEHGEAVKHLRFREKSDTLASAGLRKINIWNFRNGQLLHTLQSPRRCMGLVFDGNMLIAASDKNELHSWDLDNISSKRPVKRWRDSEDDGTPFLNRPPRALSVGTAHQMLAVAYTGKAVTLWDTEEEAYYGTCGKKMPNGDTSTHPVTALLFNPNASIQLLAVSYLDGELVILDPFNDTEIERLRAHCHTLAASPDGRLLAGGAGAGIIQIFEFDTLRLLYKVKTSDLYIKQLSFSHDGLALADLRGSQCNIWTPPNLLGGSIEDDISVQTASSTTSEESSSANKGKVSLLVVMQNNEGILCGSDDGSVSHFDMGSGCETAKLYSHKTSIRLLCWLPRRRTIISVCVSNRILGWRLDKPQQRGRGPTVKDNTIDSRLDSGGNAVINLFPGEETNKFILTTRLSDHLWNTSTGTEEKTRSYEDTQREASSIWVQHPQSPMHVMHIEGGTVHIHSWLDWSEVANVSMGVGLNNLQLKNASSFLVRDGWVLLELEDTGGSTDTKEVLLCNTGPLVGIIAQSASEERPKTAITGGPNTQTQSQEKMALGGGLLPPERSQVTIPTIRLDARILSRVAHVIGVMRLMNAPKLVFLDTDSWVSSLDLGAMLLLAPDGGGSGESSISVGVSSSVTNFYTRHFFVPYDWFAGMRHVIGSVTNQREVVFGKSHDVAIIKGGLEFAESVDIGTPTTNSALPPT